MTRAEELLKLLRDVKEAVDKCDDDDQGMIVVAEAVVKAFDILNRKE